MSRGGKRQGSGRKPRYGEPTTTVRVPISIKADVLAFIEQRMASGALDESVTKSKSDDRPVDSVAESKPEPIDAWVHADGRCQASTAKGERCGNKRGLMIIDSVLRDGRIVKFTVCPAHKRKWERLEGKLLPHSSVKMNHQKNSNTSSRARKVTQPAISPDRCMAQGCSRKSNAIRTVHQVEAHLCIGHARDVDYEIPVELVPGAKTR